MEGSDFQLAASASQELVVKMASGDLVTTSTAISTGTQTQHKNVLELVRTYINDFREFGGVAFETQPFVTGGGTQWREVALLNEQQATLLITYMRNNEVVRGFKKALVRAFYEAKSAAQFSVPTTLSGALRLAAEQAEVIEAQAAQLEAAKPAVAFVDNYVAASTGSKGFREVCKLLKANEAEFGRFLLDNKIMYFLGKTRMPYATHLDAGRFEVKAGAVGEHAFTQAKFTAKGVSWIAGEWAKHQIAA